MSNIRQPSEEYTYLIRSSNSLPLLNIEPVKTQVSRVYQWLDPVYITVDNYVGKSKKDLPKNMHFVFSGEGDYVIDQLPVEGTKIEENGEVWLYFGEKTE